MNEKNENAIAVVLPNEVTELANNVSIEKKEEVISVLSHVFSGVSKMREQLDSVNVADENDKVNMKLANTIRLGVREVRLQAEKDFDKKRKEVQMEMISFKTEDALWLKAKQTMQILTKEIEEVAKWKETTKERIEKERHDLKIEQRLISIQKFNPEITRFDIENLSDVIFETLLSATEMAFEDKIEAEKQAELKRIAEIEAKRIEDERIRKENEKLRAENESKEKQRLFEQKQAADLAEKERQIAAKKQRDIQEKANKEREESERKLQIERNERAKLAAEIEAKKSAELKAEKERIATEKKAAAAPDKDKLVAAINAIVFDVPKCKDEQIEAVANVVNEKFEAFKKWAVKQTMNM